MCLPSNGDVSIQWAIAYASLRPPSVSCTKQILASVGVPIATARNNFAHTAIAREQDYLFFLDDDVLVPDDTLSRMHWLMENNPDWDALTGVYVTKTTPPEPLIFAGTPEDAEPYWDWKMGEVFPVWGAGLGCCMIRVSAFDKLEDPYFAFAESSDGANSVSVGEDLYFFRHLYEAGGKVMCDGTLLCGHIDRKDKKIFSMWKESLPYKNALPGFLDDPKGARVPENAVMSSISS